MPTYEYVCQAGHSFERLQKINDRSRPRCPECGKPASRKISGGAGLVFKGSGFYVTDYGKDGKGPRKASEDGGKAQPAAESAKAADAPASTPKEKPSSRGKAGSKDAE